MAKKQAYKRKVFIALIAIITALAVYLVVRGDTPIVNTGQEVVTPTLTE